MYLSNRGGRARILPLLYLFAYRFFIVPATSISLVYLLRSHFPHYIKADPMLDFVLAISHVGPPAITLAALAQVSGMDEEEQGVVATVLLASYVVTPLISLSVSFTMTAIVRSPSSVTARPWPSFRGTDLLIYCFYLLGQAVLGSRIRSNSLPVQTGISTLI